MTLSALVLGPLLTTLPLSKYFTDPQFFRYFGNIVGWITFYLPGVFQQNDPPIVNINLWTLPSEFDCYVITAALMSFGLIWCHALASRWPYGDLLFLCRTCIFSMERSHPSEMGSICALCSC